MSGAPRNAAICIGKARARRKERRNNRLALVIESRHVFRVMSKGELKRMMNEDARPLRVTEIKHA